MGIEEMRVLVCLALLLLLLVSLASSSPVSQPQREYLLEGHAVYSIEARDEQELRELANIEKDTGLLVDFWLEPRRAGKAAHLRVPPSQKEAVDAFLAKHRLAHSVKISNLAPLLEQELEARSRRRVFKAGDAPSLLTLDQYHDLDEILAYLDSVASTYPSVASTVLIGQSLEGRDLKAIKIGNAAGGAAKASVLVDGTIHAREWIAGATMLYIINELTERPDVYKTLLDAVDVYVLPITNPDGYVYTWTTNRMWRKTRSGPRQGCYGVDPNRNWNFKWMVAGSSSNPCSETYAGPSPNSEVETLSLANYLAANNASIKAYFDIHSYSEDFMYPFGYAEVYPDDLPKIRALAQQATDAVNAVNKQKFVFGSITDIVYPASGSSIDFTKGLLNIDYSYAMELRPSGNVDNGFILPESQILAGASEAWAGISAVFNAVAAEQ